MKAIKQTTKRLLAMFLAFLMVFTMVPTTSFASEMSNEPMPAEESEDPSPYGYDETDVDSVTVNVTLSNNGIPIKGQDGTVLSNLEVTVPYFDLANYGLEDYYRYTTENEVYVGTEVIKRPTLLHLYIYLVERYYMEVPADECGTGTSGILEYAEEETVYFMDDEVAYNSEGSSAFLLSGAATSMYMNNFWGHSENLMYYRNHRYPLMSTGWGSTADYILLSDGDRIDLGMFSNWEFYNTGAFLSFDQENYTVTAEETFTVATRSTGTTAVNDSGITPILPYTEELDLQLFNDQWESVEFQYTYNQDGTYSITAPSVGGTYYVMASDPMAKTSDNDIAPATAAVTVAEKVEEGVYEVTVNVAPSTAEVTFYAGYDAEEALPANKVIDNGIVESYHQYVLKVKEGQYSYRAVDGETNLGGMAFNVPVNEEILEDGSASGEGQNMTLLRTNWYTTNAAITNIGDYTLRLLPGSFPQAVNGDQYVDENSRVVTPVMVMARGNALTYQAAITINGELAESYAVAPQSNITFGAGSTSASNKTFTLSAIVLDTITAPKDARVQMFNQLKNFNVEEIPVKSFNENEDGTITYTFATPGGSNLTYRVSMDGKITRAGYMKNTTTDLTFTFEENEDPSTTENKMDNTNMQSRIESSTMLNVNAQNNLKLGVDETFRLRAFRGAWQIINTDTANIMIEPDFNYTILSGAEHIELTPADNRCTGNAGIGDSSNWMDIKGVSEGTAVLEVTYDAIMIGGDGTSYDGLYGATDPQRKSLVIINVGESGNTLSITADGASHTWDTEFDTVYFTGETGEFTFTALLGEDAPEKVELSTDSGKTFTEVTAVDGKYTAAGLVGGNNILKVTKGNVTEYQIVRAAKVTYTIVNKTRENDLIAGDTVEVTFKGMYTPLSKFSGIYNPGFATPNHNIVYTLPEGVTATASGGQYNFITNNSYKVTFENAGEITLTNGHIYHTNMGSAPSAHRELTDDGVGSNFSASNANWERSVFPDLTFSVMEMPIIPVTFDVDVEDAVIVLTDEAGTELTAENGVYQLEYANYNYIVSKEGYITERGIFSVSSKDGDSKTVTIHMRKIEGAIWDGTSVSEPEPVDDVYQIGTGAELAWFAQNAGGTSYNAILTDDISLGGFNWTPIAKSSGWKGTFDGNGHYVTDLYIDSTENNVALFGYVSSGAVVKNLGVKGEVTTTGKYAAGIATAKTGTLTFTIENCKSEVNVTAEQTAGGIIANQGTGQTVKNCYNTGKIKVTREKSSVLAGGISAASSNSQKVVIENCYNTGNISGMGTHGSVVYVKNANYAVNVINSYGLVGTSKTNSVAGTDVTAEELRGLAETLGDAYMANPTSYNNGYPILTWEEGRILPLVKEEAIAELSTYKNADDYREAEAAELANIISNAATAINAAESMDTIQPFVDAAKAEMDALKTDAEYTVEELEAELAAALAAAKEAAKKEVAEYKNAEDYREAEAAELANIISETITAIDAAETVETVAKIVEDAKAEMDALPVIVPVDPADDSLDVPVDMYTATAGSTQPGGSPNQALDGDSSSFWEVAWDIGNTNPELLWYQIELADEVEIDAVRYLPRWGGNAGNVNGFITEYRIEVSTDGENWTTAATGTWEQTEGWKIAEFEAVTAKYVRITGVGTYADVGNNSNMSIAEIRVRATGEVINKGTLKAAIAEAEGLVAEDYVDISGIAAPLAAAKEVVANTEATQEEVDAAAAALRTALDALVKVVKKDALAAAIADAKEIDQDLYTSTTAAALADAIAAGEALVADEAATQEAIDAAVKAIEKAISGLKAKATAEEKAALQAAVDAAEAMDTSEYTEESAAELADAIAAAKEVLADADATAKDVEDAADDLQDAIDALEVPVVVYDEVVRLYGAGRYETGYAVADALKEALGVEKFEAVVVATGKNFADALAGSYLAVERCAPILLTNGKDDNVAELHAYIAANVVEGGKVYILGGEGAVPATVDAIDGYDVVRLFGDSRYDTNLEILAEAGVAGDSIIVATGKNFADSLSASAAKLPILLVKPNATLNDAQKAILAGMKNIYIVGGEGAVSAEYEAELAAFGTVTRVYGDSRYDTSVEVAKTFCADVDAVVVASGKNFPDGLCGGPLAAALNAPLVLTKDGGAAAAAGYVAENGIIGGFVLGGDGALADETVVEVFALTSAEEIK